MMTDSPARAVPFYSRWWFRPVIGVILLAVILLSAPIFGRITAGGKVSPEISRTDPVVSVIVDLTTEAGTFHREVLSDLGVFGGRDRNNPGDRTRVRLQNVSQEDIDTLTRLYWVEGIDPA